WCVLPDANITTGVSVSHGQGPGFLGSQAKPVEILPYVRQPVSWTFGMSCGAATGPNLEDDRFTTINMFPTVFDAPSWDCHADRGSLATDLNDYRDTVAPMFDTEFTELLDYLDRSGRLDSTLVVATGEFGRTPLLNANGGRDHWANCWTALVAGGGVKGGRVVGSSDRLG